MEWTGPEGGTILHVSDPDNLSVEGLTIGGYPNSKNGNDILQTSSGKGASSIFYDRVSVLSPAYNPKWNFDYTKRGLRLEGLKKNDTVLVKYLRGNFRCVDSSAATILCNVSYNTGNIIVEGKSKDRDGFIGVMSKLGVCENPSLTVKDNNSIVVSDYYMESDVRFISLEGSPEDPAGRVTIQGAKIDRAPEFSEIPGIEINGYKGEFTLGPIQFYVSEPLKSIVAKSTGPLSVVYLCNFYYNCMPVFNIGTGIQLHKIGNRGRNDAAGFKEVLVDTEFEAAIPQISRAFDDLRRLGKIDMQLNHPGATAVEKRKNDANK